MKNLLRFITIILFIPLPLMAEGPSLVRTIDGKFLLQEKCRLIEAQISGLKEWIAHTENRACSNPIIVPDTEGICLSNVTACLPQHVKKFHDKSSTKSGPNCWNLALVVNKILPSMRETSDQEFDYFLSSPLCKEIVDHEKIMPGDIGTIESRLISGYKRHIHGFIHVGKDIVYNKLGIDVKSKFQIMSYQDMHKVYPINALDGECKTDCSPVTHLRQWLSESALKHIKELPNKKLVCGLINQKETLTAILDLYSTGIDLNNPPLENGIAIDLLSELDTACKKFKNWDKRQAPICKQDCPLSSKHYYRCKGLDSYLSEVGPKSKDLYNDLARIISPLENFTESALLYGNLNESEMDQLFRKNLGLLLQYLRSNIPAFKDPESLSLDDRFILGMISIRLEEMAYALGFYANHALTEVYTQSYAILAPFKEQN